MTINDIPADSILRHWMTYLYSTEVPFSYGVAGGLSAIGAVLRRSRWIDQVDWRVYPNQSVMFIGPSGVGKDTIINRIQRTLDTVQWLSDVPTLGGVTMEALHWQLAKLPAPASAVIPAPEMTAFFGKADYQQNMLTGVTNLLSNGNKIDISTKGGLKGDEFGRGGKETVIREPTVTMLAGSTIEWLHKSMPDGTMEGGFLGRFLIVAEELGARHIPLVKANKSKAEMAALQEALARWTEGITRIIQECKLLPARKEVMVEDTATGKYSLRDLPPRPGKEVVLFEDAEYLYSNWYHNRFKLFSRAVAPYANRSRDTVLRLAMLMAFSRGHYRWIEAEDVQFAINLMNVVAERIDAVCLPPTPEAAIAKRIVEILPATRGQIYQTFAERYRGVLIEEALKILSSAGRIETERGSGLIRLIEPEEA